MKSESKIKAEKRIIRHARIRSRIKGDSKKPRLAVFKSNKAISAQIIDDEKSNTIVSSHSKKVGGKTLSEKAKNVGIDIAKKAKEKKISEVVFDRGGFIYTGNIKTLAEGAREGGLKF